MRGREFINRLYNKMGIGGVIIIVIVLVLILIGQMQGNALKKNPCYTKGVIIKIDTGSRGSMYLFFIFFVEGKQYESSVSISFCRSCKPKDSVLVVYQKDNPDNNGLVHQLPKGASLNY